MSSYFVVALSELPKTTQAVQACHAIHEHGGLFGPSNGANLILSSYQDLTRIMGLCEFHGIPLTEFREPDLEILRTAIAFGPVPQSKKKLFSFLPLIDF